MKLSEYLKKNKISGVDKIKKFLLNKTFIINGNSNSHNYGEKGTRLKITNVSHVTSTSISHATGGLTGNNITYSDLDHIISIDQQIKYFQDEMNIISNDIKKLQDKQKIMKELKITEWDEDMYKVYQTLKILKTKKSDIEKSKIISDLIKK